MSVIKKDEKGLYLQEGGWIARPSGETQFKEGDRPKSYHFGGSPVIGVGKEPDTKRGKYLEYWRTDGLAPEAQRLFDEARSKNTAEKEKEKMPNDCKSSKRIYTLSIMIYNEEDEGDNTDDMSMTVEVDTYHSLYDLLSNASRGAAQELNKIDGVSAHSFCH